MRTETIDYEREGFKASLVISEASSLVSIRRIRMYNHGQESGETDIDRLALRLYVYPDLLAASVEGSISIGVKEFQAGTTNWIPFEEFANEIPDEFLIRWENAVYNTNPSWIPRRADDPKGESESQTLPADSPSTSTP